MSQNLQGDFWVEYAGLIDQIWTFDASKTTYMKLYTMTYEYCMSSPSAGSRYRNQSNIVGEDLYHYLEAYVRNKCDNICKDVDKITDENILRDYKELEYKYKRIFGCLTGSCYFLNRHWFQREYDSGRRDIYEIGVLFQRIWTEIVLKRVFPRLIQACLKSIKIGRKDHSSVDTESIRYILQLYSDQMFIEMINNEIYTEDFESEFLQEVDNFYRGEKVPSIESNDEILTYLTSIGEDFDYEIDHAKSYLPEDKSTLKKLIDLLGEIFIPDDAINIIVEKMKSLVSDENNYQELAKLFEPVSRIPKLKNELVKFIEKDIYQKAVDAIKSVSGSAINDPQFYIETIIDIYKKFLKRVQKAFGSEQSFIVALDKAFGKFINDNAMTQTAGSTKKSPEWLARYCDTLLRKGSKSVKETDLEEKFGQIMMVFNYIDDKDVFLKFYDKMLSKRLIDQLSASDDYEESIISKLKVICGYEYTLKLERMFQDIGVSRTLTDQYRAFQKNQGVKKIVLIDDFSVMVLTSNSWSFSPPQNIVLPIELKATFDNFTEFYTHQHSGRKLMLLYQHSKGELQTSFTVQKYILQVSIYQMMILLLFNKQLFWTVEQIQDRTQIQGELLLQILWGLLKNKLLICADFDEDSKEMNIKGNSNIQLATDFKSDKLRVNLNVPLKSIEQKQKDISHFNNTIDEERKMVIQAAIVRIMKSQQKLKHALLIQQVIEELSSRFKPNIPSIKKWIDLLIEKEYLQRDPTDKDILLYLA